MKHYHIIIKQIVTEYTATAFDGNDLCDTPLVEDNHWECTWEVGVLPKSDYHLVEGITYGNEYKVSIHYPAEWEDTEEGRRYIPQWCPPYDITEEMLDNLEAYFTWENSDDHIPEGKEDLFNRMCDVRDKLIDWTYAFNDHVWDIIDIEIVNQLVRSALVHIEDEHYERTAHG